MNCFDNSQNPNINVSSDLVGGLSTVLGLNDVAGKCSDSSRRSLALRYRAVTNPHQTRYFYSSKFSF